jgi:adenine-specific DNA-methyltransferase
VSVLTELSKTLSNKINMIYLDPPYNSNNHKLSYKNTYSHDTWIKSMRATLTIIKEFLASNGTLFISIDDYEMAYLKVLCDEIFGRINFITTLIVNSAPQGSNGGSFFRNCHEYILVYAKNKENCKINSVLLKNSTTFRKGPLLKATGKLDSTREKRPHLFFPILYKNKRLEMISKDEYQKIYNDKTREFDDIYLNDLKEIYESKGYKFILPLTNFRDNTSYGRWRFNYESMEEIIRRDGLIIKENIHGITLYKKLYRDSLQKPKTILDKSSYTSTSGVKDLRNILPDSSFTYPKPLQLIKDLIEIGSDENSIILDAFSGSGTTGQAVLELNKNNTSNRSFILIDLDTSITSMSKLLEEMASYI